MAPTSTPCVFWSDGSNATCYYGGLVGADHSCFTVSEGENITTASVRAGDFIDKLRFAALDILLSKLCALGMRSVL